MIKIMEMRYGRYGWEFVPTGIVCDTVAEAYETINVLRVQNLGRIFDGVFAN